MIETKTFELRDRGTFCPVVASRIAPFEWPEGSADRYLARHAGYGAPLILLTKLEGGSVARYDSTGWNDRTFTTAHAYIATHWRELASGDVVDVEFILHETVAPKISERLTASTFDMSEAIGGADV